MISKSTLGACLLLGAAIAATGCGTQVNIIKCRSADPDTRIAGCTAFIQAGQATTENLSVAYNNRGTAYDSKRDYDRAIQDFNEALRLSPNYAYAFRDRGLAYYAKRDYDHAIQDFNEVIRLAPNYASAYYNRGNAYGNRGNAYDNNSDYGHAIQDYNEAIQDYNEAIHLNPSYALAYHGRGIVYDRRGLEHDNPDDYDHAIQDYNEAIRLGLNGAGVYQYRGLAYAHGGDYDRAIQDLGEAIRLNPKDPVAYLGRGVIYNHKEDYDRAIQGFDEAIRLDPKNVVAHEARGETYLFQSNLAAAVADYENAIAGAPSSRMAVSTALMLDVAMKRQGRDDSRQLLQAAAAADLSKWPGPVLKLDMGKMSAAEVVAAANKPGDERQKWHVCEANYFTGENALEHNQRATAVVRLKAARDGCPKWDATYLATLAELQRLGTSAAPAK